MVKKIYFLGIRIIKIRISDKFEESVSEYFGLSYANKDTEKIKDILDDTKSENISIIDLKNKTSIADYFIIATCRSSRHADSTADEIIKRLKNLGINCPVPSGKPKCDWVIVDAGEVIVHLFREEIRALYSLEKLWGMNFNEVDHKSA